MPLPHRFGFLIIDLSPKTLDRLRFCTNFEPTVFYIPSEKARITDTDDDYTTSYYAAAFQESHWPTGWKC